MVEARGLKPVDSGGTSDPFIKILQMHHGKLKTMHKTTVMKKTLAPKWPVNKEKCILAVPPTQVRLIVKDHNTLQRDVELGEADLELGEWFRDDPMVDRWVQLGMGGTGEVRIIAEYREEAELGRERSGSDSSGSRLDLNGGGSLNGSPASVRRSLGVLGGLRMGKKMASRENIAQLADGGE